MWQRASSASGGGGTVEFIDVPANTSYSLQKNDIVVFPYMSSPNYPTSGTYNTLGNKGNTIVFLITATTSSISSGSGNGCYVIRCGNIEVVTQ